MDIQVWSWLEKPVWSPFKKLQRNSRKTSAYIAEEIMYLHFTFLKAFILLRLNFDWSSSSIPPLFIIINLPANFLGTTPKFWICERARWLDRSSRRPALDRFCFAVWKPHSTVTPTNTTLTAVARLRHVSSRHIQLTQTSKAIIYTPYQFFQRGR